MRLQQRDTKIATPDGFLDLFGRPPRESSCECERVGGVMLGQALSLVNGPTVADAIAQPSNEIARIVSVQPDDALLIDDLFVRVLSRPATSGEKLRPRVSLEDGRLIEKKSARRLRKLKREFQNSS